MLKLIKRASMPKHKIIMIRIISVLLALVTASIFMVILGHNPLKVYGSMLSGAFGSPSRLKDTITITVPLVIASLGILIAFKMKFWNIGGEGQIMMGAFAASFVALNYSHLPRGMVLLLMLVASLIGGGLYALIPALLKVRFGTNETIITLMLNYIAIKWITYLQYGPWKDPKSLGFPKIANYAKSALLPKVFGVHIGWIIALLLCVLVYLFIQHSKKGYEITVIGESMDTARYAGIHVNRIMIMAMFMSGAICGLVGMIQASGVNRTLSVDVSAGYGFTAIITAWLSGLSTIAIVPVSLLFAAMIKGGSFIQTAYEIPQSVAEILQSMILFYVLGSEIFIRYRVAFKKKQVKEVA